jgi:translation initiation factor 3 subunit M
MTTLVETSEEEPTMAVARAIAEVAWHGADYDISEPEIAQFCKEAQSYLIDGRYPDLVNLLLTSADQVLKKTSEKDMECIFTVISNLVSKAQSPDDALAMADQIANKLTVQPIEKPVSRLKILFHLYNVLEYPYGRFLIFRRVLKLAVAGKVPELVVPTFKRMDAFIQEWNVAESDKRDIYLSASNILKDQRGYAKDSYTFLVKYLATFADADSSTLNEAKEEAVRAVIEFVKSPDMFQKHRSGDQSIYLCDLLDMPAVKQLERDSKYAPVYRLLEVFLIGRLSDYLDFQAADAATLKNYGLVHEECVTKMRLMSLVGLATSGSGEIPYAVIRDTLKVADDEVEYWIVRAIAAKLLEAKMDQLRQVVIIGRCTERVFGPAQWQELRRGLYGWKENINNVSRIIANAKAAQGGIPQGM